MNAFIKGLGIATLAAALLPSNADAAGFADSMTNHLKSLDPRDAPTFCKETGMDNARKCARWLASQVSALELLSFRCDLEGNYIYARGEVKNISTSKLENVVAVGSFKTARGELVKSGESLIEYRPLMPGQTSPFKVMATRNPEGTHCQIGFRLISGEKVQHMYPNGVR